MYGLIKFFFLGNEVFNMVGLKGIIEMVIDCVRKSIC